MTTETPQQAASSFIDRALAVPIAAYLIALTGLLLYALMQLWPLPVTPGTEAAARTAAALFGWEFTVSSEVRLGLLVAIAGALGGLIHATRSLYWYIGNDQLVRNWLALYLLLPLVGATLALVAYFALRGGFFSPQAAPQDTSPFGFVAVGALIGMFSEQAVLKLKTVAETVLTKAEQGKNAVADRPVVADWPAGPKRYTQQ